MPCIPTMEFSIFFSLLDSVCAFYNAIACTKYYNICLVFIYALAKHRRKKNEETELRACGMPWWMLSLYKLCCKSSLSHSCHCMWPSTNLHFAEGQQHSLCSKLPYFNGKNLHSHNIILIWAYVRWPLKLLLSTRHLFANEQFQLIWKFFIQVECILFTPCQNEGKILEKIHQILFNFAISTVNRRQWSIAIR